MIGVTAEEIEEAQPIPCVRAAQYAAPPSETGRGWRGLTSSTMLERRNNGEIIRGGGLSARIAKRWVEDLGVSTRRRLH